MTPRGAELQFILRMRDEASRVVRQAAQTMRQLGQASGQTSTQVRQVTHRMTELNQSIELLNRTMSAFDRTVGNSLRTFSEYDRGMTIVRRVTNMSREDIAAFSDQFDDMTDRLRAVPVTRLNEIAGQAAQLGIIGSDNILEFTRVVSMLETSLVALGDDAPKLIVRVLNATGDGVAGVERFGNVLVRMAKSASASEERILQMTAQLAQATAQFDVGAESLLGLSTAAADLNFAPELFGGAINRTLTQLYEAALNNTQGMRSLSDMIGITADEMERLIRTDPAQALILFAETMDAVGDDGRSLLQFLTMFNLQADENRRVLGTVSQNVDMFRRRLAEARLEAELQIALNQEFNVTLEAFFATTQATANAWYLLRKQFGQALAPAAIVVLNILTNTMNGLRETLQSMPEWAQGIVAWSALAIPAFIAVSIAVRAVLTVFALLGGTTVVRALVAITGATWTLVAALVRLTIVAGQASAALLLLGGRAVIGGLAAGAASIGAWIAGLTRVVAFVGVMAGFGRIVAVIARAFALVGAAVAAVAAALGGISVGVVAAIAAAIAAIGGAAFAVYNRWDQIRQDVMSGTRSWAGAIAHALWDGIKDGLTWARDSVQDFFADGIGFSTDSDPISIEAVRPALEAIYAQRWQLQDGIEQMIANGAPPAMIQRAQDELDALTDRALFLSDIIAHLSGMPLENATQAVQDLFNATTDGQPVVPTEGVVLGPIPEVDTSVLSRISDENRQVISDMDDYSQTLAEVEKQLVAIQQLWSLPTTDPFFAQMGIDPDEVADYIRRLEGLANFRLEDANPVNSRARELQEEIFAAEQVTAQGRQQLQIEQQLIDLERQRGALTQEESARITALMRQLFDAQRDAGVANAVFDLEGQVRAAQAVTVEQRNRVAITQRLIELERELGALTDEQVARIEGLMQQLQILQSDNSFRDRTQQMNDQLAMANAIFQVERDELAIQQQIAQYERENGQLSAERRAQMEGQLRALQQMQNIMGTINSLDPRAGAFISYIDNLNNLRAALDAGAISQEYYTQLVAVLERNIEQALDPLYQMRQTILDSAQLQSLMGPGAEAERAALEQINDLRRQGFTLTQQQTDAIRELHQAMAQLSLVSSTGLEAWSDEIGTVTERILDMQSDLARSFRSSLVDAIYGADNAWSEFFLNASKRITEFYLDTAFQQFTNWLGNDLRGLLPGMPTQASAAAAAQGAANNVDQVLRQLVQAQQVDIAANVVNLQGFAEGALGNPNLGAFSGNEGILNLIRQAEGTAGPNGYNTSLGYGAFLPGGVEQNLTGMTLREILELQRGMLAHPDNSYNSSALGAYQIVGTTLGGEGLTGQGGLISQMGLSLDQLFTPELQDQMARVLLERRQGQGLEGLRNEWEGLRNVPDATINGALANAPDPAALAAAAEAQERLNAATLAAGTDLTGAAQALDTTAVAARGVGTDVTRLATNAQVAGTQTQMVGTQLQTAGIQATVSTSGVTMAANATGQLGTQAAAAAPRITQAANALSQAGNGIGGGGLFAGFGTALLGFGLGLLGNALRGDPNKKTVTYKYETPNVAITKLHGGGIVGTDGLRKGMDYASAYISAPKFHDGLKSNEFRAVLERGERVLTEKDNQRVERVMASVGNQETSRSAGVTMNMYVNTPDAGSFRQGQASTMAKMQAGLSRAAARRS